MAQGGVRFIRSMVRLSLVVALGACSPHKSTNPLNPKSDGVLIQAQKSDIQKAFANKTITVINAQKNIYKIEATLSEVKEKLPQSLAEENVVIKIHDPISIGKIPDIAKRNSIQEIINQIQCVRSAVTPNASIGHVSGGDFVVLNNVRAGSSPIILTAQDSSSNGTTAPTDWFSFLNPTPATSNNPLAYHWIVEAPPGSSTQNYTNDVQLTVNPDRNGGYTVILVVQDLVTRACDLTGISIGATIDIPYQGQQFAMNPLHDFEKFFHLPMIEAEKAWDRAEGEDVVVAVIDTGMNYNHADIANALYINTREIANNGLDDDGNGLVDDIHGFDFAFGDSYPFDDESHGTHVSGLIAGAQSGVAPKAKILPIKAIYPTGSATLASVVASILYATQMKVDIINMSLGGEGETSGLVKNALEEARNAGILIVVASGNSNKNVDETPFFFTEKDGDHILAVGATDEAGNLTNYSNFGVLGVGIAAPGGTDTHPIMSTYSYYEFGDYVGYPGTSMASPIVAGVAALVKSVNKSLTSFEVKAILKDTSVLLPSLANSIQNGRFVNANNAVQAASMNHNFVRQ